MIFFFPSCCCTEVTILHNTKHLLCITKVEATKIRFSHPRLCLLCALFVMSNRYGLVDIMRKPKLSPFMYGFIFNSAQGTNYMYLNYIIFMKLRK